MRKQGGRREVREQGREGEREKVEKEEEGEGMAVEMW